MCVLRDKRAFALFILGKYFTKFTYLSFNNEWLAMRLVKVTSKMQNILNN